MEETPKTNSITAYRNRDAVWRKYQLRVALLTLAIAIGLHVLPIQGTLIPEIILGGIGVLCLVKLPDGWGGALGGEQYQSWLKLPTLEKYWENYPQTKTSTGPKCRNCGSKSHQNWGLCAKHDGDRIISCRSCNTTLYRI